MCPLMPCEGVGFEEGIVFYAEEVFIFYVSSSSL